MDAADSAGVEWSCGGGGGSWACKKPAEANIKRKSKAGASDFKSAAPQVFAKLRPARNFAGHPNAFRPIPACVAIALVQ